MNKTKTTNRTRGSTSENVTEGEEALNFACQVKQGGRPSDGEGRAKKSPERRAASPLYFILMQERRFVFAITVVACSLYLQNSSSKFFFSGMEEGTLSSSSHTRTSPLAFGQGESLQLVAANVLPVGEFSVFMEIKQNHV